MFAQNVKVLIGINQEKKKKINFIKTEIFVVKTDIEDYFSLLYLLSM